MKYRMQVVMAGAFLLAATLMAQTSTTTPAPTAPTKPMITVVAPNGGESWAMGSKQTIQWTYMGPTPTQFRILLSTDSGKTYPSTLANNVGAAVREAKWTVKGIDTHGAMIKVIAAVGSSAAGSSATTVEDASDAPFSLVTGGAPSSVISNRVMLISPANQMVFHEGHADSICWKVEGAQPTSYTISLIGDSASALATPLVIAQTVPGTTTCYAWTPTLNQQKPLKSGRLIISATYPEGTTVVDTSKTTIMITPSQGVGRR